MGFRKLVKSLVEEGRKKRESTLKKGEKSPIVSTDTNGARPHDTINEIAENKKADVFRIIDTLYRLFRML